jgi:hypothetical protein
MGCALSVTLAVNALSDTDEDMVITPKGYGAFEIGQIGHGYYFVVGALGNDEINHIWQQRAFSNLGLTAKYKDILEIDLVGEGMMAFSTPQIGTLPTTMQARQFYYIKSANALISLGNTGSYTGKIQVGYFPYKYNKDVRNLGEYLLRSLPYPIIIYSDFDYPQVNLLGFRFNFQMLNRFFSNDLILHSETVTIPVQNWSITDIFEVNFRDIISVGGGISLYHWLSAYQGDNIQGSADAIYYFQNLPDDERQRIDTSISFKSEKLMARLSINTQTVAKLLFDLSTNIFSENDGLIYGEFDLLGVRNYPIYYENMKDRIIWTFGFNLPTFKILDLFNFEFEYCANGSSFSDANLFADKPSLKPEPMGTITDPNTGNKVQLVRNKWRRSLYLKKSLFNDHFSIIVQIARDHKKINFNYFEKKYMSFQETLPTNKDWWWAFKTEYKF